MQIDIYTDRALELVRNGKSFFISGKAGTGKTTLLRKVVDDCKGKKNVVVLAPTGVAARNANGVTIHSFLHVPLSPYIPGIKNPKLYKLRQADIKVVESTQMIIIDEISMVRCDLLDAMDDILRHYRKNERPFGGIQMVMFGDLYQLMPVVKDEDWQKLCQHYKSPYFFSSKIIEKVNCKTLELMKVYRQGNPRFVDLLNHIREGFVFSEDLSLLESRFKKDFVPADSDGYIRLTTHNSRAEKYNVERLNNIQATSYDYKAIIKDKFPKDEWPTEYVLQLKVGARVMFIRNDNNMHQFFNGTLATVTYLDADNIKVKTDEGFLINVEKQVWDNIKYRINKETKILEEHLCGSFIQYPLKLAWAITIHKSQGLTFDKVVIDAGKSFTSGQVYVALSRCRKFHTIVLVSHITEKSIKSAPVVADYFTHVRRHLIPSQQQEPKQKKQIVHTNPQMDRIRWMVSDGLTIKQISEETEYDIKPIYECITKLVEQGETDVRRYIRKYKYMEIKALLDNHGIAMNCENVKSMCSSDISPLEIELVRADLCRISTQEMLLPPLKIELKKTDIWENIKCGEKTSIRRPISNNKVAEQLLMGGYSDSFEANSSFCTYVHKPYKSIVFEHEGEFLKCMIRQISFQRDILDNMPMWFIKYDFTKWQK